MSPEEADLIQTSRAEFERFIDALCYTA